ncbi:unnamed protein product [Linum trigynum]|uniref:Reverse transcriptase zinc-binding domain-containing protein n=1 Tax=Linum trigynum TaxID=586398 RepID=A0AAV2D0N0_9ROSI
MNGEAISTGTNENTLVADWIDGQSRSWNSHIFPPSIDPVFSQRIESIPIGTEEAEDFWVWGPHPNGTSRLALPTTSSMSIKRNATSTEPPPSQMERDRWKWLWSFSLPQKIKFFIWKCSRGAIATKSKLYSRKCSSSPMCPLCTVHTETINHFLFQCQHAQQSWMAMFPSFPAPPESVSILE